MMIGATKIGRANCRCSAEEDRLMPEDYSLAAIRHFRDAALLEQSRRLENADQLFGFATECAIKRALAELPACLAGGRLAPAYHKHVNHLWDSLPLQGIQRRYPNLLRVLKGSQQPFSDWSADQRYGPDGVVTPATIERHRRTAARILGSVGLNGARAEV
jgi:hypothetical protein